ncbi:MAG: hypothetical protein IPM64_16900 [Phycisphaerales bacterium]|nr:hypothetical protein [Phycisphaerales bacterium]
MFLDYLTRAWKLLSLAALWFLSAAVLASLLYVGHAVVVGAHDGNQTDWAYAFTVVAGGLWLLAAFGRMSWTMAVLRDGLATYRDVAAMIGIRFVVNFLVCAGAAAGALGYRWLGTGPSAAALQGWFIAGAVAGFGLGGLFGNIHEWRVREQLEKR